MIGFPSGVRVHLALEPHVMRKSFNGLSAPGEAAAYKELNLPTRWYILRPLENV